MVGSSIIKRAFLQARSCREGVNLGIDPHEIWWQGYSGLTLVKTKQRLELLSQVGPSPNYILLHVGANDLGSRSLVSLKTIVTELIEFIARTFPGVKIIWSEMLPRSKWRYSLNSKAMNKARKRLNSFTATKVLAARGHYLVHSDLHDHRVTELFDPDGVHLSSLGNHLFLTNLAAGIETFVKQQIPVHGGIR